MSLRNVQFYGQSTISDQLESNILYWLNYNLISATAFYNVRISTSGGYGGEAARLRLSDDPNFTSGKVWESFRKQWIWQSGTESTVQPIQISGVYVNNIFRPATGVGPYSFNIDYPNGRIIFNSAISTSSVVKAEYSCHHFQLYNTDSPFWRDLQRNSFRVDKSSFLMTSSGDYAKSPEKRIQLPCVIVEATPEMTKKPYEIGSLVHEHNQDIRFYIIAETNRDRKWITDLITGQNEERHGSFDVNMLWRSGVYPINLDGTLNGPSMNYPDLVSRFSLQKPWSFERFKGWIPDGMSSNENTLPLFVGMIQATVQTYLN